MRERVFPKWTRAGKLRPEEAQYRMQALEETINLIDCLGQAELIEIHQRVKPEQGSLF